MNKRITMMLVIAVLALGLSGLAQDKSAPPEKPRKAQAAPGQPLERLKDALQITPEQEAKLEAHRKAAAEQRKAFTEQMAKVREEMQALRKDGAKPDPAKSEALIDKMFKLRADQAKAALRNQAERDKIFTPEQLEKMKNRGRMMMNRGTLGGGRGMALGQGALRNRMQMGRMQMGRMMNRARTMIRGRARQLREMRRRQVRRWIREE